MIAITGASGKLGTMTIQSLLKESDPKQIVAVAREPRKLKYLEKPGIVIRTGNYKDKESLVRAFQQVDTVLQISTTTINEEGIKQEQHVVDAAVNCGVKHIVYTSSLQATFYAHFLGTRQAAVTESCIKNSGLGYSFFRNSLYMEVIPDMIGNAVESGIIRYPAGDGKVSFISRNDIAKALARVLLNKSEGNHIYEITGSRSYSFMELANILTQTKGRRIVYEDIPLSDYQDDLMKQHIPPDVTELLTSMAKAIRADEFSFCDNMLHHLLNREPISLKKYIHSL